MRRGMIELTVRCRLCPHAPGGNRLGYLIGRPRQKAPVGGVKVIEPHVTLQHGGRIACRIKADRNKMDCPRLFETPLLEFLLHLAHAVGSGRACTVTGREDKAHQQYFPARVIPAQRLPFLRLQGKIGCRPNHGQPRRLSCVFRLASHDQKHRTQDRHCRHRIGSSIELSVADGSPQSP